MNDLLGAKEINERFGLSRTQIHRLLLSGEFPPPEASLARGRVWQADVIEEAVERLRAEGRITPGGKLMPHRFIEVV